MKPPRWTGLAVATAGLALGAGIIAWLPEHALFSVPPDPTESSAVSGERWACPMMDFIGTQPGNCPVCGMKMTRVTSGELTEEQQRRMGVELVRVSEGTAVVTVRAYGAVRYDDRTFQAVIPRVGGRVVKRHTAALHAGTRVAVGDPVIDLYSPEAFAAQSELAAAVKLADGPTVRALFERFERWNLTPLARDVIEGKRPVDTITIVSPFAGLVVLGSEGSGMEATRLPQVGQEIMPDTLLLRLADPEAFMVVIHVPETQAHWLREGQPVMLATDDRGELPDIEARVAWLAPELNLEIRAREVHVHLRDPKHRLLAGSLVSARLQVAVGPDGEAADPDKPETHGRFVLVPKAAVLSTGVRHVAWKAAGRDSDGRIRFELATLVLGPRIEDARGDDHYVVRSGLQPGDEVAAQGAFLIDSQAQLAGASSLLNADGASSRPSTPHVH